METKNIPLTTSEWQRILIAIDVAICSRKELIRKCVEASESGVQTVYTLKEWIALAEKAQQENAEFYQVRNKILRKMY